ncbi:TetR/AcrR family transcriptional regulator [Catenuloplanes indicus]|uniref:AcrR family transcriptional regulator n=1 Tax=Catenuloplanes indicus TaxID=137267 RepID=A0AAE3W5K3_9ACTN|nr:TetR/AcrR family transcriptional regulator [Catenuloplanes indicus]MDQ0369879.1 AcrR family transcriptional regulator [Catenuloplanes indicus]
MSLPTGRRAAPALGVSEDDDRPRRSDARLRRSALLTAVGELIAERGTEFPLAEAAERAGISTATAYRNFSDTGSAVDAYFADLMGDLLEAFDGLPVGDDPLGDIRVLCHEWVAQATRWGAAAVHMRSPRGLLARRNMEDPFIGALYDRLARLVETAMTRGRLPQQDVRFAVLMWVTIFDERVVIDLTTTLGWSERTAADHLTEALLRTFGVPPAIIPQAIYG